MSIYATEWILQFPRYGDFHHECEWIQVIAQGVPAHIGTPTPGYGYEKGDPYSIFLPPPMTIARESDERLLRAIVFVTERTRKGTPRSHQEYEMPLLILSGDEYGAMPFRDLHDKICDSLRGNRPRVVLEIIGPDGSHRVVRESLDE